MAAEIALLTNPSAGRGRGTRTAAIALPRLREAGFGVRSLVGRDAEEALHLVRVAVADGVDRVVVVGGDGMVHLATQALAGSGVPLGVVPAGSGNDAARALGLPRSDPQRAADVAAGSRTRRIDLARCTTADGTAYVVTVLAAGFDARVTGRAHRMRRPRGRARYTLAALAELRVLEPLAYTLELDGRTHELEAVLVAVGNGPSYGGGLRIAEGAELDDGLLDVVVVRPMGRLALVRTYPSLFAGRHRDHPAYEHHRVRGVRVAAAGVVAHADGERLGPLPVDVEVVPGGLEVLVP